MTAFRRVFLLALVALFVVGGAWQGWAQPSDTHDIFFLIEQGDFSVPITPISQDGSAFAFYNFNNDQSNTGLEVPEHSLIVLHVDRTTDNVSLILIQSSPQNPAGGSASFSFDGLPAGAQIALRDDETDTYNFTPPTAQMSWQWLPEHSDGVVINNLGDEFELTITPNFISGINAWDVVDGETRSPTSLPNLFDPVTIRGTRNAPPEPRFSVTPESININVAVTFDASESFDSDGTIAKYEWDFDGDGVFDVETTRPTVQHTFSSGGTAEVTLRVTDSSGGTAETTRTFTIAEEIVSATRTISTPQALPGLAFRVRVDLTMRADVNGLGLDESLPSGWEVTPIDNAGATFKRAENQWVFPSILRAGETRRIVYDVTVQPGAVSSGPLPARLEIAGDVDSASPAFRSAVIGERGVEITSCLSIPVALAHLDPNTDVVDLRNSEEINFDQLQRAVTFWIEEIGVPQTCDALVDLEMLKTLTARELTNTPVDQPLQQLDFADVIQPTATRTVLTPLPFHQLYLPAPEGDAFRVRLDVSADQDVQGLAVSENLPQTWQLRPVNNAGASFNPRTREWLFTERVLAGETRSIVYEVVVDEDETSGSFAISGSVSSALPSFQAAAQQDGAVEVVECLSVPVAIAHLNTREETIDISLSNQISFDQIQAAIAFWLEDQEVVGTCGKTIDFEDIKALIAAWLTDTPVDQPLSETPGREF